jgi:hypothetical protein
LNFTGSAAANTVLYTNAAGTVKVTLNREIIASVISCIPDPCRVIPSAITTDAVVISLDHADIRGSLVSGDIIVAESQAQ